MFFFLSSSFDYFLFAWSFLFINSMKYEEKKSIDSRTDHKFYVSHAAEIKINEPTSTVPLLMTKNWKFIDDMCSVFCFVIVGCCCHHSTTWMYNLMREFQYLEVNFETIDRNFILVLRMCSLSSSLSLSCIYFLQCRTHFELWHQIDLLKCHFIALKFIQIALTIIYGVAGCYYYMRMSCSCIYIRLWLSM